MEEPFNAYIDGFNLYMGALIKNPAYKWLDLLKLCSEAMPQNSLNEVHYFTARVKERFQGDKAPARQHAYLRVLTDQGVQVHLGKFRKDSDWTRITATHSSSLLEPQLAGHLGLTEVAFKKAIDAARPDRPKTRVERFEEKGSDVNLASYLLRDAYLNKVTTQLVITGDSDLLTPMTFAVQQGVAVHSMIPNARQRVDALESVVTSLRFLDLDLLSKSQLPELYQTSKGGVIRRPSSWT